MITPTMATLPIYIDVACWLFVSQLTLKTSAPMLKNKSAILPPTLIHKMASGLPNPRKKKI